MKLLITPTSPYARKARIVILEKNLSIPEVPANPWEGDDSVTANNPLVKIPVLLTDNGAILDSRVICEFLDGQNDSPQLLPSDAGLRAISKTRDAIAEGALDAFLSIVMAGKVAPDMKNDDWKNWLMKKTDNALDYFNKALGDAAQPDMADITLGCLLGSLDFRAPQHDWRASRPALADWYTTLSARPSFVATVPRA